MIGQSLAAAVGGIAPHLAAAPPPVPQATGISSVAWLLLLLPAASSLVLFVGGKRLNKIGPYLGCATVVAAFFIGLAIFLTTTNQPASDRIHDLPIYTWMPAGSLQVPFGLHLDPLSLTFVLLITGVGALIHIYSIGYMEHDPDKRVFFAEMNLFVTAMLLLVLGNSFVTLYFGWEGVGLASYLLIGFWSYKPVAASAAKKSFVMNRVGDVGFALAIFLMFRYLGTTDFSGVFAGIPQLAQSNPGAVTAMALLLLLGACGKSGQAPLQAWLPDAMEGPTPVSALIHAATMVTAGVYLISRSNVIFDHTGTGRLWVTVIGTVTLFFGSIAGCAKDDIKRVLAYSTVSQIGYMFLAVGLGAGVYALGILHLLTHGFFKATLFLSAGSVKHGMNDDVDMRRMGGLAKVMPVTFATMTAGYLAIIGFPYLSGFFSKDPIIEAAFAAGGARGWVLGLAAWLAAGITAFYMTRLMIMTFFGEPRWKKLQSEDGRPYHPHECKPVMYVPMILTGIGALGAGAFFAINDRLMNWLAPSLGKFVEPHPAVLPTAAIEWSSVGIMVIGALIAWLAVGRKPVPVIAPPKVSPVIAWARADVGGNFINETLFARPGIWASRTSVFTDAKGIDGAVNGISTTLSGLSTRWRRWQNGYVRSYALSMLSAAFLVMVGLLVVRFA